MDTKIALERHEEQIKTLFKRVDDMEDIKKFLYGLDKSYALQSQLMANVVEHNQRQDERMDKQDKRLDEQHQVIVSINENLTELTEGQRTLNNRVGKLEDRVEENDVKHTVDLRDINKEKNKNILAKYAAPFSVGLAVGTLILEFIKIFK